MIVLVILTTEEHRGNADSEKCALIAAIQPICMRVHNHRQLRGRRKSREKIHEHFAFRSAIKSNRAIGSARNHVHVEHGTNARKRKNLFIDERTASHEPRFFAGETNEHDTDIKHIISHRFRNRDHAAHAARVVVGAVEDAIVTAACVREVIVMRGHKNEFATEHLAARRKPRHDIGRCCWHLRNRNEHRRATLKWNCSRCRELCSDPFGRALAVVAPK